MSLDALTVITPGKKSLATDLLAAVAESPTITNSIEVASTVEIAVEDTQRQLLRTQVLQDRATCKIRGVTYELVAYTKSGSVLSLTFEDAIAATLRRRTRKLTIRANTATRGQIARKLAHEARVTAIVDPARRAKVHEAVKRGRDGDPNSWDLTGTLADDAQLRRFSNGKALVFGSDAWLLGRDKNPTKLAENTGPVGVIDFDLDAGKRASSASLTVDAEAWALPQGDVVQLSGMGPADGRWLVAEVVWTLTSTSAAVKLTRGRHALKEPKPPKSEKTKSKTDDEEDDDE